MTAKELIESSLRLIGVIATGQVASGAEISDGFESFNQLLDSLGLDGLTILSETQTPISLIPGQETIAIGPELDIDIPRPGGVDSIQILLDGVHYDVVVCNIQRWRKIQGRGVNTGLPTHAFVAPQAASINVSFYPVPDQAYSCSFVSRNQIPRIESVNDELILAPGYERALKYNLAGDLAGEYGKTLTPKQEQIATSSLAAIKRKNTRPSYMTNDAADLTRCYKHGNILSGGSE